MSVVDPVCGMELEDDEIVAESEYRGKMYYFCSDECADEFESQPQKYAGAVAAEA